MTPLALDIDHIGIAVRDLDAGEKELRSLGFRLTQRSHHRGSPLPGAPIEEWGSANHCAMLMQGYIELVGLTDPKKFSSVKSMLESYEGTHIVAFKPRSVREARDALMRRGVPVDDVRDLERMAAYGPSGEERKRVAFRNMYLTRTVFTEARFQYTEHLTPEVMWQPGLLDHPNGAIAVTQLFLCSAQSGATAGKLAPALGIEPSGIADGEDELRLANSRLTVMTPTAWARRVPRSPLPPLPAPVGLAVRVKSLSRTRSVISGNGVQVHDGECGSIWVETCNTILCFSQSPKGQDDSAASRDIGLAS